MILNKQFLQRLLVFVISLVIIIPIFLTIREYFIEEDVFQAQLFYINSNDELTDIHKNIPIDEPSNMVRDILERLSLPNPQENLKGSLIDIQTITVDIQNDIAIINLSNHYNDLSNWEEVLTRSSIVWSLTSLDFIQGVIIKINGEILSSKSNYSFGIMNRQNVIINSHIPSKTTSEYQIVNLYFANSQNDDLVAERRLIEVEANKGKERTILEQLIIGPKDLGNISTIPKETKINDVTTTNDGICYVNLSYDFISKHSGTEIGELLTIYSIVNTLCEVNNVSKIQFLIDGERLDLYKGYLDFSKPFEAKNLSDIKLTENNTTP